MSDDDKTQMKPPAGAGTSDRTVIIPRPGNRQSTARPAAPGASRGAAVAASLPLLDSFRGRNILASSAGTLFSVIIKLRNTLEHKDTAGLQRQLVEEIKQFESRANTAGVAQEQLVTARYALCTSLDEAIMNTPWGATSNWSQNSLLSTFHNEGFGGEKFFNILTRLLETPGQNVDLLEFYYTCICLGFEGKYRMEPRGRDQLELVLDNLYRTIEQIRPLAETDLSPSWRGVGDKQGGLVSYLPLWMVSCCVLAVLLLCYSGFRWWLYDISEPTAQQIQTLSAEQANTNKPRTSTR
ncbi:MAG: type VI secretion system protein ImpK [Paraglaciecola psychrophila]|jgi:type VI secretion system protein ImpK